MNGGRTSPDTAGEVALDSLLQAEGGLGGEAQDAAIDGWAS